MDAINRVFKFQLFNLKKAIGSFLLIILIVNVIGYSATIYYYPRVQFGIYYNNQLASIAGATMIAIIIFLIVYGIIMYHENYRLALSFTATRKDFYKSTIIINIIAALIFATFQSLLQVIDKIIIKYIGLTPWLGMQIYNNPVANFILTVITIFTIFLFISSLMNIIGILQYRFTYKFWIGLGIIIFVASTLFGNTLTHLLLKTTDFYLFLVPIFGIYSISVISILIAIPSYIIAYFLFRKTTC